MAKIIFDLNGTLVREIGLSAKTEERFSLYPGINGLLRELKALNYELFVWTMASKKLTGSILKTFKIDHYFLETLTYDEGLFKPDIQGVLKLIGGEKDAYIIGDSSSDMLAGKNAGITSIGALWDNQANDRLLTQNGAKACAKVPSEVLDIISRFKC